MPRQVASCRRAEHPQKPSIMAKYQSYVICTSPRSGSTLLCKLLAATGISGNPNSYFHNPSIADWTRSLDLAPDQDTAERDVLRAVFGAVRARGTDDTGIFGLRVQRKSFDFLIQKMNVLHPGLNSDAERFQAAFGNTLFIHLTRSNKLEQAISLVKATQTGLWHKAPDGTELERASSPKEPVYDADEIALHLANLTALDEDWKTWFANETIDPFQLSYDMLSADPAGELARILEALGLDTAAANGIRPGVAKLADLTSRDWQDRFLAENGNNSGLQS
ncbi:MAG: Stf0 family sulfotransferase [Alphaproteobacteria bacterium]